MRLALTRMLITRSPPALLVCTGLALNSGCRLRRVFTRFVARLAASCSRDHLRLDVLAARLQRAAEPIGICLPAITSFGSEPQSPRSISRRCAARSNVALLHTLAALVRPNRPLLRFSSLQRLPIRDAQSGANQPPDDPAAAFARPAQPARPRTFESGRRPCGFPPCEGDAA